MAIAALPAPLKIPLIKNNSIMITLLPIIIAVNSFPYATASGFEPINIKISSAYITPKKLRIEVMAQETNRTCAALLEACSGFFSPILRATTAVAAMLIPIAMEYITESTDSVSPTVWMA